MKAEMGMFVTYMPFLEEFIVDVFSPAGPAEEQETCNWSDWLVPGTWSDDS